MLQIDAALLKKANSTPEELTSEIACLLYSQKRISIGLAKEFADMDLISFQKLLSGKQIQLNYSMDDFDADLNIVHEP